MKPPGNPTCTGSPGLLSMTAVLLALCSTGAACRSPESAGKERRHPGPQVTVIGSNLRVPASEAEGTLPSTAQTVRRIPASEIESKGRGSLVDVLRLVPQIR